MIKVKRHPFHIYLETSNGAGFSIPIEVIRGVREGVIDDSKYRQAAEFLSLEGFETIYEDDVRAVCEKAVDSEAV